VKAVTLLLQGNVESTLDCLWEIVSKPFVQEDTDPECPVQTPYESYAAMCVDLLDDVAEIWLDKCKPVSSTTIVQLEEQKSWRIGDAALSYWASGALRTIAEAWVDEGFSRPDVDEFLETYRETIIDLSGSLSYLAGNEAARRLG
jgi:hypothetical protein